MCLLLVWRWPALLLLLASAVHLLLLESSNKCSP
jgi:hypothetical protein